MTAWKGISIAATKHMNTNEDAFPLFLTIIHAARLLTMTMSRTDEAVMSVVVTKALKKWISVIAVRMYCNESVVGKARGLAMISSCPLKELTSKIHKGASV